MPKSSRTTFARRLATLLALTAVTITLLDARPAVADEEAVKVERPWQRVAFPLLLAASGVSLAGSVGFFALTNSRTEEFNRHMNPTCLSNAPGRGGPPCDALHDDVQSARRWSTIGLVAAGGFAVTALAIKLTEPAYEARAPQRLACAPGFGVSAACRLTF